MNFTEIVNNGGWDVFDFAQQASAISDGEPLKSRLLKYRRYLDFTQGLVHRGTASAGMFGGVLLKSYRGEPNFRVNIKTSGISPLKFFEEILPEFIQRMNGAVKSGAEVCDDRLKSGEAFRYDCECFGSRVVMEVPPAESLLLAPQEVLDALDIVLNNVIDFCGALLEFYHNYMESQLQEESVLNKA